MVRHFLTSCLIAAIALTGAIPVAAQEPAPRVKPSRFAIIFNRGYGGDNLPTDPVEFEKLVSATMKANFNVIMGKVDEKRLEICKKHDMLFFVDLLVDEHHIYKNVESAKKLCESLKGNPTVYGYHLWSDVIGKTYPGRTRDVMNVQMWDPTHPAYVGTYRMTGGVTKVKNMDLFGYYDFHWARGGHWGNLGSAFNQVKARNVGFMRYDAAAPGIVGKGNVNRVGYTFATSIPLGLRGYLFHYAGGQINPKSFELDTLGQDLAKVNGRFLQVGPEIMKISLPTAVYSSPATKSEKNDPIPDGPKIIGAAPAVPKESWFQIKSGEVIVGVSTDGEKRDVLVFANHNPYESQMVVLSFPADVKSVETFDRASQQWRPAQVANREVGFVVEDYGVDLVRVRR